jgi:hypothetical protein
MDEVQDWSERETRILRSLANAEDLAAKKAKIYSHLLTEQTLAEDMDALAIRHEERRDKLVSLSGGDK